MENLRMMLNKKVTFTKIRENFPVNSSKTNHWAEWDTEENWESMMVYGKY